MFSTLRNPALVRIYVIPLLFMTTASMTGAISVVYALDLGASITQVNLISTIRSTMGILLLVPFGILSDRYGRRPMLLYPRVLAFLGILVRALATDPNHLIIAAFVGGFAGGGFFPVLLSMVADVAEPGEQQEAISTMWLFSGAGMLLGPFIGSLLLMLPQVSLRNLYQFHVVAYAGSLLYLTTQIKETTPQIPKGRGIPYKALIADLIRETSFRGVLVMAFLLSFYNSIINTYIPIHARVNLNLSNAEISSLAFYRNLAVIVIRFSSATFLAKAPTGIFLISAIALGGISSLAAPLADNYRSIVLIRLLSGVSYGATRILGTILVAVESEPRNRGIANSLYDVAQSTGNIANILTSTLAETQGLTPVFLLGGASALSATLPVFLRRHRTHRKQDPATTR